MSFNLGFIGGGNMSSVIFRGIVKNDIHPPSRIWVSGPHLDNLRHWQEMGANVTLQNEEVFSKCDIVVLGVKPGVLHAALRGISLNVLRNFFENENSLVVSMLAGVSLKSLQKAFIALAQAPAAQEMAPRDTFVDFSNISLARIMPNVPMAVGSGICLITYQGLVGSGHKTRMNDLLKGCGICEEVSESLIDSLGVLTACGPAYIFMVIEALADGAVKQGVPRAIALRSAALMVRGSANLVLESNKHPGQLKDEVCSPGGSTICGVSALEDGKLRATLINALEASTNRTKELDPNLKKSQ